MLLEVAKQNLPINRLEELAGLVLFNNKPLILLYAAFWAPWYLNPAQRTVAPQIFTLFAMIIVIKANSRAKGESCASRRDGQSPREGAY